MCSITQTGVGNSSRYSYNYCLPECVPNDSVDFLGGGETTGEGKEHREGEETKKDIYMEKEKKRKKEKEK